MAWMYPGTTGYGTAFTESLSRNTWCYFCSRHRMNGRKLLLASSCLAQAIISTASSAACIHAIISKSSPTSTPVSLSNMDPCIVGNLIIILLMITAVTHVIRGILKENVTEVAACIVSLMTAGAFIVINYRAHTDLLPATINIYACGICTPVTILLARWSTSKFRCARIVGAADSLRFMYEERTHLLVIMRIDLVFMIVYALVSFSLNSSASYFGYYTCCAIMLLAFLKWLIGKISLMQEKKTLLYVYVGVTMLSHLWIPVHLLFVSCFRSDACERFRMEYSCISIVAAAAVIFDQIYIMIYLLRVFRNFGYGLTDRDFLRLVSESTSLLSAARRSRGLGF